jgi:hypothetical protein
METKTIKQRKNENPPSTWLPEACHFGRILESNQIKYAVFGAGALAAHKIIVRPTIDIDFVVEDFLNAVNLIGKQPDLDAKNEEQDKDGISVADFHFKSGVSVQIWNQNLYSLPMNPFSWSKTSIKNILGYGNLRSISVEDVVVSKIGRFSQQKDENEVEADKNIRDILSTITYIQRPDYKYIIQRLKDGARRESPAASSKLRSLDWFFVREVEIYQEKIGVFDFEKISRFVSNTMSLIKSRHVEYHLLNSLRKVGSLHKFQEKFMLNDSSLSRLLERWKFISVTGDKVTLTAKNIQTYLAGLTPNVHSEYYKRLLYSGKKAST